jgi:hypothetical protein
LSVGDQILYQKFSGAEIKLEDATYILLAEADILGRVVELDELPTSASKKSTVAVG